MIGLYIIMAIIAYALLYYFVNQEDENMTNDITNEQAIEILKSKLDGSVDPSYEWAETVRKAIEALKKAYSFEHVIIKHPTYGDCDGWIDRQRMLLFLDPITCEFAIAIGISWEADNED